MKLLIQQAKFPFFLFLFVIVFFARALFFQLSYLDDSDFLLGNLFFFSDPSNLPELFLTHVGISGESSLYRPFLNITFMADVLVSKAAGIQSWLIPHLSSIIFHAAGTVMTFAFLVSLEVKKRTAFILSLFFAVHPSLSSAAVWLYGRNDPLLAIFILFTFIIFLQYQKNRSVLMLCGFSTAFLCALLLKETAILFIPLPFLWIYLGECRRPNKTEIWKFSAAMLIPLIIWTVLHSCATLRPAETDLYATLKDCVFLPVYLGKAVFPFLPGCYNMARITKELAYYIPAVLFLMFVFRPAAIQNRRRITFGLLWFALMLLPTFFHDVKPMFLFEHRLYLPMAGLLYSFAKAAETDNAAKTKHLFSRSFLTVLSVIFFIFSATASQINAQYYSKPLLFWNRAAHETPEYHEMLDTLGMIHEEFHMPQAAEKYYKAALDANPEALFVNFRLAKLYMSRHLYKTAAYYLEKERARNLDFTKKPYFIITEEEIKRNLSQEFMLNKTIQSENNR